MGENGGGTLCKHTISFKMHGHFFVILPKILDLTWKTAAIGSVWFTTESFGVKQFNRITGKNQLVHESDHTLASQIGWWFIQFEITNKNMCFMKCSNLKAKYYALECSDKNTLSSTVTLLLSTVYYYPNWNASGFRGRPISLLNIHNRATCRHKAHGFCLQSQLVSTFQMF